ncbi:Increased DNA methylation 1 [Cardamine amara subsp. amara]|uniref:Increased DNA methylation 1 n=1 Tax=Cardamine amara subsp. amara TaxID=228776 RepID=A0ABD1AB45_CARAN
MDFKDPCNFLSVEAELSPGSIERWLSTVKDGKKSEEVKRRSNLSITVKKHLSALGWVFSYAHKGKKRELRYKSPKGKWFYSLATACMSCVDQHSQQQQTVPKYELSCSPRNLKKRNTVEDFNTNGSASNQEQQQKKRRKTATEEIIIPRLGKSLKVLQAMEKKQQQNKNEKESLRFWRKDCGPDKNCDVCCVCHWGGELLLCDGCPSAFHHTCLGFSTLPKEDLWFCPCCCCDICGSMESPGNSKLMICEQCQRRFHLKCLKEEPFVDSCRGWFCSSQCNRVYSALQNLLGCKIAVGSDGDLVWTLMRAPNQDEHYDDEQISKLDSAVEILHQGFEPSTDRFSGRDLVEELIYRRDGTGMGRGFYTVLIEKKKEPITVAAVRVDKNVAEIPLLATLSNYRRSGMCRVLMDELEKQMSQMGVCRLVLPAAQVVVTTWTQRFGFSVTESSERLEFVKHGMLDFVGTVMCHKFLVMEKKEELEEENSAPESSLTQ